MDGVQDKAQENDDGADVLPVVEREEGGQELANEGRKFQEGAEAPKTSPKVAPAPVNAATGLVGALDHVLKKTFKDFYDVEEELPMHSPEQGMGMSREDIDESPDEDDNIHEAESELSDNVDNEENNTTGESLDQRSLQPEGEDSSDAGDAAASVEDQQLDESVNVDRQGTPSLTEQSCCVKDVLGFDGGVPAEEGLQAEISVIEGDLREELDQAKQLEIFLEAERAQAAAADQEASDEVYSKGLLVGAEFPLGPSHYAIDAQKLREFGEMSAHLINVNRLLDANEEDELYKRGQVTRGEDKACEMRPSTPNYLLPKERDKAKALMAAKAKYKARGTNDPRAKEQAHGNQESFEEENEDERSELSPDEAESFQRQEEAEKRRRELLSKAPQMTSDAMQANMELLARMKKQIDFLKNPRFTLTTRATRDWRASLLNKDLSEPSTFAADEVKHLEESWDVGFLDEPSVLPMNKASTANADACGLAHIADIKAEGSKLKEKSHGSPELSFSFNVDPGFAFFTHYEVNEPQECLLKIVNVACVSRGLRFLPPTSKYFSIADAEFPSTASVVAPGMACHLRIAFCADSLGDYRDFVTVCTETERFRIALVARRTPPRLSLSRDLNAGSCFVGTRLSRTFPFSNQGGPARFRLVSEGEWAAQGMHANADEDTGNDLQLQGGVFTVSPRQFNLVTGQETALHVRFAPQTVGSMNATFLIVCDNCQVQLVTVRAASCQVKIEISRVGNRQLDKSRKALLRPPQALDFGSITSGGTTHKSISYLNPTPIALNFHWAIRDVRARASEDFAIEPKAGTLEPGAEQSFTLRFSPVGTGRAACIHRALAQLVIDNIPPCAVDGASSRQLKRSSTKRGASAADDGLRSVPCSRLSLTGGSKPASVSFAPSAQIKLHRPLLADQQGEVSTTIHNTSDCIVSISWSNLDVGDHGRTTFTPTPTHVQLAPNEKTKVRFAFVPRSAGVLCHSLCCNLNGRPSTHWLCVNANVVGPSVVLEAREVDFGLIGVGKSSETNFVIRNTSTSSSARVSLQDATQGSTDAKEDKARISITNGSTFLLAPQEARTVSVICEASNTPERMRKCWSVHVQHSSTLFINLRAEIQSPKVFLQVSEDNHQCKLDFGTTYVTVPVSRTVRLVNLSNLAAPFRWVEPSCDDDTSADEKAADERAISRAYDVRFSCHEGTLEPKESRDIVVSFEGIKPGRVASLFACEVEGMPVSLGFSLHSLVRGLVVAYSLVGPEVSAAAMAPGRPPASESGLGGTATSKGSSTSGSGAAAPASGSSGSSASNTGVPALDFGSDLELCKRKRLRLCIVNHSAITTKYEVVIKAFAAKTVPRSLTTPDDENNSPSSPGNPSKPSSLTGQSVAKLGSAHEEWSVYASKSGRKYIEAKVQALEDREVLSAGRGVAFLALPKTGMLRPWQAVIIDVYCFNNMPGRYRSELHCLVDGLNPSVAPIKASVQGSPLCLASNTVGLVKRQGESRLHFGHPLVGTEPVYKVIKVSNNGPVAANVSWRIVAKRGPKADLVETSIAFDEHKMAEDIDARVHVKLRPHADLTKAPPFVVEPHTLQIRPYASGSFRVTFFPDSAEEAEDAAIMIADADWVDEAHLRPVDDDGAAVSILTLENLATELLTSSIGTVQVAEHCNGERTASRDSRASRNMSPPAGAATRAPLRDFERIHLGAHSAKPCLELDRAKRGPQGRAFLGFVAWSTRARDHGSFFKTLTFTNSTATHTCCVVRTEPPFVLNELRTTSASTAALPGRELAQLREVVPPEVLAQGQEAGLPPGATLALTLRFQPAALVNKLAHDPNDVLRTTYPGVLDIYFHNGEHQGVDLEGTVVSPAVLLAPAVFDFGYVHVETTTRTVLYMANPTVVPASWRVSHVPKKARAGISSPNNPETIDDPSCWSFDIESGVLAGPTLPLASAQGYMPKGFDSNGKRLPLAISLCFSPSRQGFHETKFRFVVDAGLDFDIVVRGTGSYEECHDTLVRPLPAPWF